MYKHWWSLSPGSSIPLPHSYVQAYGGAWVQDQAFHCLTVMYKHWWCSSPGSSISLPHSYVQALVGLESRIKHSTASQLCTSIGDAQAQDQAFHCLTVMYKHWWHSSLGSSIPVPHSYVQALVRLEPRIKHSTASQLCMSIGDARVWNWACYCFTVMYKHWWHSSPGSSIPLPHSYVQALVTLEPRIKHSTASQLCTSIGDARVWNWACCCLTACDKTDADRLSYAGSATPI